MEFTIRRAAPGDAEAIIAILEGIASELIYSAISEPWSVDQQRNHLLALSPREAIHVAESKEGRVLGYQILERWAPTLGSMSHVGQIGTFVTPDCRGQGIGQALFKRTLEFARNCDYLKFVIQVRSSNLLAQAFYRRLGFRECGRLGRQVRIGDQEDDELIMEFFLAEGLSLGIAD
jgi:ribosomal protein S18 acetylase RimI-like enzyme